MYSTLHTYTYQRAKSIAKKITKFSKCIDVLDNTLMLIINPSKQTLHVGYKLSYNLRN